MNTTQALTGQTAIITGGGTGIGRGIAMGLAGLGVKVVICGRRAEPLEETAGLIQKSGGQALPYRADVSVDSEVEGLVRAAEKAFGPVDILINNAGIGGGAPIHRHSVADWDRIMATNLRGPFLTCRALLPGMRQRRRGHIVNISSESAYGVTKHALNALGEFIQRENQELGIRVDTICPGMVVTPMAEGSPNLNHDKCLFPEDIADLVIWLLNRRPNVKIGHPILIQTMENPWL